MDIRSEPVHPQRSGARLVSLKSYQERRPVRLRGDGVKRSMLRSILTDVQLWVPVGVLILGTSLLMILRDS
jgi:hypothetical protein